MSTHSRTTTIRAIEAPPSITSSYRSKPRHSEDYRSTAGTQLSSYRRPQSHTSRPSRYSRSPSTRVLQQISPADFPLPRSARKVPLPSIKPGARISITMTNPEETTIPLRGSHRGVSSPGYTKRTTETYVFSPRNNGPRDYSLPSSSRTSQFSARSHRSHRAVRMPSFSGDGSYRSTYARRPERLALPPPPERTKLTSRVTSSPRSAASSTSTSKPVSRRALEEASLLFDDAETLAPSDSISQASGKARRRQRIARVDS